MENSEPKDLVDSLNERVSSLQKARVKLVTQLERAAADINRIDGAIAVLRDVLGEVNAGDEGEGDADENC